MSGTLTTEQARALAAKRKSPGRKRRADEDAIKAALETAIPEKAVLDLLASACRYGHGPDKLRAISIYLNYKWGKPVEKQEISGPEGNALEVIWTNDWRRDPANAASGATDSDGVEQALPLADGGAALAQDDDVGGRGD